MKIVYKIKHFFRDRRYDVYCPHCESCGVSGCCPPTMCTNHKKGFYCESNMGELRSVYHTFNDFYNWLAENKANKTLTSADIYKQLDETYDREMDEVHEYFKLLPKKLTLVEKIKKIFKKK